jgi:hypothetical protein
LKKSKTADLTPELRKLKDSFRKYREEHPSPQRHYSDDLKIMVVSAKKSSTLAEISRLTGVTRTTVSAWLNDYRKRPKRLKIVPFRNEGTSEPGSIAHISIGGRIRISVPTSELSTVLIGTLLQAEAGA